MEDFKAKQKECKAIIDSQLTGYKLEFSDQFPRYGDARECMTEFGIYVILGVGVTFHNHGEEKTVRVPPKQGESTPETVAQRHHDDLYFSR